MKTRTFDQMALGILLSDGSRAQQGEKLATLAKQADQFLTRTMACPDCGSHGPHEDNGCTGSFLSILCTGCGTQWDPE